MEKVLGVSGSPRKGGNSDVVLERILDTLSNRGLETRSVYLRDIDFKGCIGCERCRKDKICTGLVDGMTELYPFIQESRGLVLVSPCYNYNITALMKALIDRMYCYYDFTDDHPRGWSCRLAGQDRKAVAAVIGEQTKKEDLGHALDMMKMAIGALGYDVVSEKNFLGLFQRGKAAGIPEILAEAEGIGQVLADSLE